MFRKEFAEIIGQTGMVPLKDLRPLLSDENPMTVTELKLLEFDFFDDVRFAKQVAQNSSLAFIDLGSAKIPDKTLGLLKKQEILQFRCLPIQKTAKAVTLAIYDPTIMELRSSIQTLLQHPVEFIITNLESWGKIFASIAHSIDELAQSVKEVLPNREEGDKTISEEDIGENVVQFVTKLLVDAFIKKASDIHVEPYENDFRVRFRIDGTLFQVAAPPKIMMLPIISKIKLMSQMDIAEKRKPQDGRIKLQIGQDFIDFRVSSIPGLFGEKIVLRLLDSSSLQVDMTKLGFETEQLKIFKEQIHRPFGMCLVTGPTGSGKTTTLYSAVAEINDPRLNITTAEDPVEFNFKGINQVNVRKDIGLTFASALRAFLRQDPDVILVGEIRDEETAEIAIEAALTGHMVFSTLHTNDAASTVTRLLNMGIEPFLVTSALNVIVAQRLCRRICTECKQELKVSIEELVTCGISANSAKKVKVYHGAGCKACNMTGYKGRIAIHEVLQVTAEIREAIIKGGSVDDIKRQAIKAGMKTLRMAALTKVAKGLTTLDEAIMNSNSDDI